MGKKNNILSTSDFIEPKKREGFSPSRSSLLKFAVSKGIKRPLINYDKIREGENHL